MMLEPRNGALTQYGILFSGNVMHINIRIVMWMHQLTVYPIEGVSSQCSVVRVVPLRELMGNRGMTRQVLSNEICYIVSFW